MKRRWLSLSLAAAMALFLLTGCGADPADPADTASPGNTGQVETPAPTETTPAAEEPVEYDFTGLVLDGQTQALTGFEGLPWGYVLPQELVDDLGGDATVTLRTAAQLAGLDFQAEQVFSYTDAVSGLTEDQRALTMGQYVRTGYYSLDDPEGSVASAVADFNRVLAYLTEVYGAPTSCTLDDGELSGPLTAAQFGSDGTGDCLAAWNDLDGATVRLRLSGFYGGSIMVSFGAAADSLS